jgi:outer membrane protein assembly factor BamB
MRSILPLGLALAFAVTGCGQEHDALHVVDGAPSAQALEQTFWYFRSNANAWDASDRTRLVATQNPNVLEVTYEVTQQWMVDSGDDAALTESGLLNSWGTWQNEFSVLESGQTAPLAAHLERKPGFTTFRIKYPALGHYKASLNLAEKVISIVRADPAHAGEIVWTGGGGLQRDALGRMYRLSYYPQVTLARVDGATGNPLWVKALDTQNAFDVNCASSDGLVVRTGDRIELVDVDTGGSKWTSTLDGALASPDTSAFVNCRKDEPRVIVSFGNTTQSFASLDRATGAVLWRKDFANWPSVYGYVAGMVIVQSYDQSGAHLQFLDVNSGEQRWSFDSEQWVNVTIVDADQSLYFSGQGKLRRLDPRTGAQLWERTGFGENLWTSLEGGALFLRDGTRLERIDAGTGAAKWSAVGVEQAPSTTALTNGTVLVQDTQYAANTSRLRLVRIDDGSELWARDFATSNVWPQLDPLGRMFLRDGNTLSLLDAANGQAVWTYTHPALENGGGGISGIFAGDERQVYLLTYGMASRYPPMQVIALRMSDGTRAWEYRSPGPLSIMASDAKHLYMSSAFGNTGFALAK